MDCENCIDVMVSGKYALFSEPVTRTGGEKNSYPVPTYEAVKGILKSIYWKPTFIWAVDKIRVMNRIRTSPRSVNNCCWNSPDRQLSVYAFLTEPRYQIRAHIEWNLLRADLAADRSFNKHIGIAKRCVARGGRQDVFLGTRDCQAYAEPCVFGEGEGFYDGDGVRDFGVMFHGFDYPNEVPGISRFRERYAKTVMRGGVIEFDPPAEFEKDGCGPERFLVVPPARKQQKRRSA